MTTCNGKCYLSKQLKKVDEKEGKEIPNNLQEKTETTLYIHDDYNLPSHNTSKGLGKTSFFEASNFYATSYIDEIFHPPTLLII